MVSIAGSRWLVAVAAVAPAVWASAASSMRQDAVRTGQQLYRTHCASCHGTAGHGDGPLGRNLNVPPADLTGITARNRGVFPAELVHRIVDGRHVVKAHGDSAMPIWGDAFSLTGSPDADKGTAEKIRTLVAYVESLQQRPGD